MSRETPESIFATAQEAMERGDWEAFFACLDHRDLLRLAGMAFGLTGGAGLCLEHGIPADAMGRVEALAKDIDESGRAMLRELGGGQGNSTAQSVLLERSLRHRDLLIAHQKAVETCLKFVTNLASFTASAERLKRATLGGGSVGSTLFVGESLCDVAVNGPKATGVRRMQRGWTEPIAFVKKKGQWYIRFLPSARSRPQR